MRKLLRTAVEFGALVGVGSSLMLAVEYAPVYVVGMFLFGAGIGTAVGFVGWVLVKARGEEV